MGAILSVSGALKARAKESCSPELIEVGLPLPPPPSGAKVPSPSTPPLARGSASSTQVRRRVDHLSLAVDDEDDPHWRDACRRDHEAMMTRMQYEVNDRKGIGWERVIDDSQGFWWHEHGMLACFHDRPLESSRAYRESLRVEPKGQYALGALLSLGRVYLGQGLFAEAERAFGELYDGMSRAAERQEFVGKGSTVQATRLLQLSASAQAALAAGGAAGDADAALRSAMSEMAAAEEGELSKQTVGSLVGMGAAAIAQAAVTFAQKSEELAASGEMAGVMRLRAERRAVEAQLEAEGRALAAVEAEAAEAEAARAEAEARLAAAKGKRAEQLELMGKAEEEMAKLRELEAKLPPDVLKELHALVAKVDALKEQQKEFKAKCKEEYAAMEAKRAAQLSGGGDDDDRRVAEIEKLYDAEHAKVLQMRRLAGQKGRQIAALQRQVDEIPNRAELLQYERRFRELYAMIAQKGDETRKYYAMYNVLEEKKTYVTKEISLINSIHENFTKVMAEKAAAREKLAESVDSTVKSVQATRAKTQARVDDELAAKAALQAKYDKLLGQQRKYFKLVKELKEAYQKQAEAEDAKAAAAGEGA